MIYYATGEAYKLQTLQRNGKPRPPSYPGAMTSRVRASEGHGRLNNSETENV